MRNTVVVKLTTHEMEALKKVLDYVIEAEASDFEAHQKTNKDRWEHICAWAYELQFLPERFDRMLSDLEESEEFNAYAYHAQIIEGIHAMYLTKNKDYGDSFKRVWDEYGPVSALTRMKDKFLRIDSLLLGKNIQEVKDESVDDTLLDLANYAIMTVIERARRRWANHKNIQ